MDMQKSLIIKKLQIYFLIFFMSFPLVTKASFIESTMGTAVVNDATAVYYNPAALALLKNSQIITQDTWGHLYREFTGDAIQSETGFRLSGSSIIETRYHLPSLYIGIPTTDKITLGVAVISNVFNKDIGENSILRYSQSNNSVDNVDIVPAIEFKFNKFFSLGAHLNYSYASFILERTFGFPSLNIPDSESHNECRGYGIGGDVGILLTPRKSTLIGLNYRSAIAYHLNGKSIFESDPPVVSNNYGFTFWTPARAVFSVNQLVSSKLGLIGTVQRIGWSIINEIKIHGIATQRAFQPVILDATVPHHLRDTWLVTAGTYYKMTPKFVLRIASTYSQSPGNSNYQIVEGDSIVVGGSISYEIFKNLTIDGAYAHAFIQNKNINVTTGINKINGVTSGYVDVVSLKLTFNIK